MKRCPQCEFIYEDDQSLCDMDGVLLVLDSRTLPNFHALATVEAPAIGSKPAWRHRTFPAMAALILATVLSLVYFVSTQSGVRSATVPAVEPITISSSPLLMWMLWLVQVSVLPERQEPRYLLHLSRAVPESTQFVPAYSKS